MSYHPAKKNKNTSTDRNDKNFETEICETIKNAPSMQM